MATDKSEPRMVPITALAVITITSIIVIRAVLQSYFSIMLDAEEERKVLGRHPAMLASVRADETRRMEQSPMHMDQAMEMLAHGRPAFIAPQASTDNAAMQGWSQRPRAFVPGGGSQTQPSNTLQGAPAQTGAGTTGGPSAPTIPNTPATGGPVGAPGALPANGGAAAPAGSPTTAPANNPTSAATTDAPRTQTQQGAQQPAAPTQNTNTQNQGDHPAQGAVPNQQQQGLRP